MKPLALKCLVIVPVAILAAALVWPTKEYRDSKNGQPYSQQRAFPYHEQVFTGFVDDSFKVAGKGDATDFYNWFDSALKAKLGEDWDAWISRHKNALTGLKGQRLAQQQIGTAADAHKAIKKTITKFSLDRGFEFYNTLNLCERQCFLQSVVIAGILQRTGMDAGVAMVYRNIEGQPTNNGHAVCLVKLADGRDIVVDASEPIPFPQHKGLFAFDSAAGKYQYIEPTYAADSTITAYTLNDSSKSIRPAEIKTLDVPFLRSQFDYYRGERAPDGILASKPSEAGLEASARYFEKSESEDLRNPLTVYMLGRTYDKLGKTQQARKQFEDALQLYTQFGWVPNGLTEALGR